MALIKCPECFKEISDKAQSCPNCGFPIMPHTSNVQENMAGWNHNSGMLNGNNPNLQNPNRETGPLYGVNSNMQNSSGESGPLYGYGPQAQNNAMGSGTLNSQPKPDILKNMNMPQSNQNTGTLNGSIYRNPPKIAEKKPGCLIEGIIVVCLLLTCLAPIGIVLMWYYKFPKNFTARIVISVIFGLLFFVGLGNFGSKKSNDSTSSSSNISTTERTTTEHATENATENTTEITTIEQTTTETDMGDMESQETSTNSEIATVSEKETEQIEAFNVDISGYNYITADDLAKYTPNLVDQNVYFVAPVGQVDDEKIQVNIGEGYMFTDCKTKTSYVGKVDEGDAVCICGQVVGQDTYGFLGNSNELKDCQVVAKNSEAEKYKESNSSDALQEYFYLTDEIANANKNSVSEEEYKGLCQPYDYEDILRNEENYKKKYTVISGTVDQIIEGWLGGYTIYIVDSNGNKWECSYTYKNGESKMLERDWVTVYGLIDGTRNSTTVLGKQVTMPYVKIEYYE